jgi:hypothetical protein
LDGVSASVRLDVGGPDHLAPLLCFGGNMLSELGWRTGKHDGAQVGKLLLDFWVGERGIDLSVELVDDLGRRVLGRADSLPAAGLVARHKFADGRDVG